MFDQIAYAMGPPGQGAQQGIGMFLPLIILGLLFGFLLRSVAKRKGKKEWVYFLIGFLPLVNGFVLIGLLSLPDLRMMQKLDAILNELRGVKIPPKYTGNAHSTPLQEYWTCTCGEVNKMDVANCPICGLKRDFLLKKIE